MASSSSSSSLNPSPSPNTLSNVSSNGTSLAGASSQTSTNSSTNSSQSTSNTSNAPVSRDRIASWITELLSSSTREAALMELSRKREKVADLAILLWHSFGSVAVLLYEV
ncbi:unnamed protein product, partial [Rotaria sp. Silwood2]